MRAARIALIASIAVCLLPLVSVFLAETLANAAGCRIGETFTGPCRIWSVDMSSVLSQMFVLGWLTLGTLPAAVIIALGWIVAEIIAWMRRKRA